MKKIIFLILVAVSFSALAYVKIEEEAFVLGHSPEVIQDLIRSGSVEIDHVSKEGFEVYGPKGLRQYLEQKQISYLNTKSIKQVAFADYPTHAEITQKLKNAEAKNPSIIKVFSIGKSIKGEELWMVKISDNVATDETEPEFKYISSMHGDEIVGRELTVKLIEEIAANYGSDADLTELVNNTEIFIMPSMNPDGSKLRQRANANGVDLNRSFPEIKSGSQNSANGKPLENQAIMAFQATRQFSLSANFHGGTIVVNYPWDSTYELHPLNDFIKELSLGYAELNPEMRASDEFQGGVTNGAEWYVVNGGMQDWSCFWYNDLQVTIELSHSKWPNYSEIPGFYNSNRNSMVYFMKQVHQGAGFKIQRANISGVVTINQTYPQSKKLGSFAFNRSEFYKVMPEGEYTFSIQEKNGQNKNVSVRVERDAVKANGNYLFIN